MIKNMEQIDYSCLQQCTDRFGTYQRNRFNVEMACKRLCDCNEKTPPGFECRFLYPPSLQPHVDVINYNI